MSDVVYIVRMTTRMNPGTELKEDGDPRRVAPSDFYLCARKREKTWMCDYGRFRGRKVGLRPFKAEAIQFPSAREARRAARDYGFYDSARQVQILEVRPEDLQENPRSKQ